MKSIKIIQVFETYGETYQPYIPPVMKVLKCSDELDVKIMAFHPHTSLDVVVPDYRKRQFIERLYALLFGTKLNYLEIFSLRKQVDVLHIQQSFLFPKVLGLLQLPIKERPKIVITLRGGDTYVKPWCSKKWFDFYRDYGTLVDAFVVMSVHQKNYLHDKWGVGFDRIHVIPISYGTSFDQSPKFPDSTKLKIISAFRMCWEKNIDGHLQTILYLKNKGIPVQYDVYGEGTDIGQLFYLIDKYNLKDCVKHHGKVSNVVLKEAICKSDFMLQLSFSESLGMSVIEAQSMGLPVVVSDSDGLPEVISHATTGYCVAANDFNKAAFLLEELWSDRDLYYRFSKRAIWYSQTHFSISNEVEKLVSLYKTLIK